MTALQLIEQALKLNGVIAQGEPVSAGDASDALYVLNDLLDAWALENLMLFRNENDVFTLTANKQVYTIGVGADFDVARPVTVEGAFVTYNGIDFPLRILNTQQWNSIPLKNFASPIPLAIYYVPNMDQGNIYFWPMPAVDMPFTLQVNMQFTQITDINATISFPPGYRKLLRYLLAVETAPMFGVQCPASVIETAKQMVASIKSSNSEAQYSRFDNALTGTGTSNLAAFLGGY